MGPSKRSVVFWLWGPKYRVEHVNTAVSMVHHFSPNERVVVFSDRRPDAFNCEAHMLPHNPIQTYRWPLNCFVRMNLWNKEFTDTYQLGHQVLSLDVDVLLRNSVARFFTSDANLYIGGPDGRPDQYWGGAWVMRPGTNRHVWDDLNHTNVAKMHKSRDASGRKFLGSDQAWLAYKLPGADKFGKELACDWRTLDQAPPEGPVVVQFGGTNNPWSERVRELSPEIYEEYERYAQWHRGSQSPLQEGSISGKAGIICNLGTTQWR